MDMRIYIINTNILAAYEDYPGAWFDLPLSFEDVKEQLLLENENQMEILEYDLPFNILSTTPLWELNYFARTIKDLQATMIYNHLSEILDKWFIYFNDFMDAKDKIKCYMTNDIEQVIREMMEKENLIPEKLRKYVQLKDYAKELFQDEELLITSDAIFHYKG